jgi:hypothetical protein
MSKKLTYEYVKNYIEQFGYKLISIEYLNAHQLLEIECDKEHRYFAKFNNFKSGKRCPECAKLNRGNNRRLSFEFIKSDIESNGILKLLSDNYKNNTTLLTIRCLHGHEFNIRYCDLKRNHIQCPICRKEQIAKDYAFTYEEVKTYIESQGYVLLSTEYKNNTIPLLVKCPNGHIYYVKYSNFRDGKRCRICSMKEAGYKKRLTFEQVKKYIESFEGYKLLSTEYKIASSKLLIKCPENHIFECSFNKFRDGQRCPICKESKGEQRVREYLANNNIPFKRQYIFEDCRNIEPLRFDFAVFDSEKNLVKLIEYDGEFHYLPIESKSKLRYQQKLDSIKNNYCQNNNIILLRIPYWDFDNIENILLKEVS